jgi:hypothetical protein
MPLGIEGKGIHHHQLLPHYRRIGQTSLRPPAEPEAYLSSSQKALHFKLEPATDFCSQAGRNAVLREYVLIYLRNFALSRRV